MTKYNGVDLSELGVACKKFRKAGGWTQSEVAEDLGLSRELISGFECGRSKNLHILTWYLDRGFEYGKAIQS